MNRQIVRRLGNLDDAEQARQTLLAEGFDREGIEVAVSVDEAGPGKGNFLVGDSPKVKGGTDYKDVFTPSAAPEHCVMTVAVATDAQADRAAAILAHFGGLDLDGAGAAPRPV